MTKIADLKSVFGISRLKYLWVMITGKHFRGMSITDSHTKEAIESCEPLITIGMNCLILTDIDSSIPSTNQR